MTDKEEFAFLEARISDFVRASQAGELSVSAYLSPSEAAHARQTMAKLGIANRAVFLGGYADAERMVAFILPAYADSLDGDAREKLETYFSDEMSDAVTALKISGSGYRSLTHRDYLGSLLSLGIERDSLGDIVALDEYCAVIFCTSKIAEFISAECQRIANDAVKVSPFEVDEGFTVQREYKRISATVASKRLDCVVSALTGLSREKSQELIRHELCQLDYIIECRCDRCVSAPCTISLRGYGKFILREIDQTTKKGRLRMLADKYI